jgi:hypothetical protein
MPSRERLVAVDTETLRAAAATRAAATSISEVARQIGLTTRGLNLFLRGSEPYSSTRQKLEQWFVRQAAERQDATDVPTAAAALTVLAHDLPPDRRATLISEAAAWWGDKYLEAGVPKPRWADQLSTESADPQPSTGTARVLSRGRGRDRNGK